MAKFNVFTIESTQGELVRFTGDQLNKLVSIIKGAIFETEADFSLGNEPDLTSIFKDALSGDTETLFVFENTDKDVYKHMSEAFKSLDYSLRSHVYILKLQDQKVKALMATICIYNRCLGYAELRAFCGDEINTYIEEIKER